MNAGLKVYRQNAARDTIRYGYGELHRFFIVLAARAGYSVAEVPVESLPRTNGHSKYGAERYLRGALDFLTAIFLSGYAERPLHLFGSGGVIAMGLSSLALLGALAAWLVDGMAAWITPLLVTAGGLGIVAVQLMIVGLLAEMINNLGRDSSGLIKVSQVMHVDRRTSPLLAPAVRVERRNHEPEAEF